MNAKILSWNFSLMHKVMDHSSPFVGSGSTSPLSTSPYELGDFFRTEVRGHPLNHDVSATKVSSKTNEVSIWKDESLKNPLNRSRMYTVCMYECIHFSGICFLSFLLLNPILPINTNMNKQIQRVIRFG